MSRLDWLARLAAASAVASTGGATWLSLALPGGIRDQGTSGLISTWISVLILSLLGIG